MTARMRRIASDFEQVKKDFSGHPYIVVKPDNNEFPEKYNITYFVNGIYLLPDGKIEPLSRHEVEITLHAEYPRYKPICKITTPIWHPNFRDGQICIGDIWGAGESLSDIIINIGDMIQYKSWNSYSPLSADAAKWAIQNKHLFPVGTLELRKADYTESNLNFEINLFDGTDEESVETPIADSIVSVAPVVTPEIVAPVIPEKTNDFEISAEELAGIEFVPTAQKMQGLHGGLVKGKKINFKTVLMKGLLWGFIGSIVGWAIHELVGIDDTTVMNWFGYHNASDMANLDFATAMAVVSNAKRVSSSIFSAFIAVGLGAFFGLGEGIYYGSKEKALKYFGIGAGVSVVCGFISGYIAQWLYASMMTNVTSEVAASLVRGIGWAIMGAGVGVAVGLIKPEKKRILFCGIGGLGGGFIGGFLFNYVGNIFITGADDTGIVSRAIGVAVMGLLIGLGIGLLEQFAKSAWLKVVRGEFEGKEYLVFAGTTSIGNNGKNTIVLFKDRLVGPHHCDITLEGNRYVLTDKGTPMGTVVNGQRITKHILKRGDAISIGNSVLVFHTK